MRTGLRKSDPISKIVESMREVEEHWMAYTPPIRKKKIIDAVFAELEKLRVFPPAVTCEPAGAGPGASLASFKYRNWVINLNPLRAMDATLAKGIRVQIADFGGALAHEARHCEQWFRLGRFLFHGLRAQGRRVARENKKEMKANFREVDAWDLSSRLGIELRVANAIMTALPLSDPAEVAEAKQWYQSVYGSGHVFRQMVLRRKEGYMNGRGSLRQTHTETGDAYQLTTELRYMHDLPEEHDGFLLQKEIQKDYLLPYGLAPKPLPGHPPVQHGVSLY